MQLRWLLLSTLALPVLGGSPPEAIWGPYRPNLYFGLRPRIPNSLMTGLMWFGTQDYMSFGQTRHSCEQGDNLDKYAWTAYDVRQGGVQVIKDSRNNVEITTEFLKVLGGDHGGSWAVRIKGKPINPDIPSRNSIVWYHGLEGLGGIDLENDEDENGFEGEVTFSGSTPELDDFKIRIVDGPDNHYVETGPHSSSFTDRIGKTHYFGAHVPADNIWKAKDTIMQAIAMKAQPILSKYTDPNAGVPDPSWLLSLPDEVYTNSNLFAVQKMFDGEFQFDVFFESASVGQTLSAATIDAGIEALKVSYNEHFEEVFPTPVDGLLLDKEGLEDFSRELTASIFGGVGYFYGSSIVDEGFAYEWDEDDEATEPKSKGAKFVDAKELLSATPSRSFFPRGFYWDEGFHLAHIGLWDNDLSLQILRSWVNLMDENGWIGREQILGDEARSKVPPEFQTQVPSYANPPTLAMAVTAYIDRLRNFHQAPSPEELAMGSPQIPLSAPAAAPWGGSKFIEHPDLAMHYLSAIYNPLKKHYDWFRRTQRGQIKQYGRQARSRTEAYRWRGRSETHVLTSGMDDYPRGPAHAGELHLDLMSWMGFFTRTMKEIAGYIQEKEDERTFQEIERAILENLDDLHWNEEEKMYCDLGVDEEDESTHVCHKGYLSLFPLMLSLLDPSAPQVDAILDLLHDPKHLWSPYGIRSLSASHPEYGQGENYWKGPIWIQMNYLVLKSLHNTYAAQEGPYQAKARTIYEELRKNVVENVYKEYQRTGYVWEQYDANNGEGRRSHPFTGWSSLVTLIISEKY